jgi:hypothetical protein
MFQQQIKPKLTHTRIHSTVHNDLDWPLSMSMRRQYYQSMRKPEKKPVVLKEGLMTIEQSYAIFGLLLGLLPPAAIFYRFFASAVVEDYPLLILLLVPMNVVCCFMGRWAGKSIGSTLIESSFIKIIFKATFAGIAWGLMTGGTGGFLFFGIGALAGALCAIPVGILAFLMFAPIHQMLVSDDMIEERHLWPLASGVVLVIVSFILSPHVFPY